MKEFLSSMLGKVKPVVSAAFGKVKPFLSSVFSKAKPFLSSMLCKAKPFLSSRLCKLILLGFVLLLVLIIGLSRCSADKTPAVDSRAAIVFVENLEVHKKPKASSRVLGRLPLDLEIDILEEKAVKETTWGLVDKMTLPDGTTVKSGWIDLQSIRFASDLELEEPVPVVEVEPDPITITITMGTITASKLNVRKGPGSNYDADGAFHKGDRVEILETKTVEDTVWGRTHMGWVGMGYVRMDGTYTSDSIQYENPETPRVTSDGNTAVLGYGIVTLNELNVRMGPDTIYGKAGTVTIGNRYAYYQLADGWARIEDGWVSTEHFYIEGTTTGDAFPAIVTAESLNIRTGPHTNYMLLETYPEGQNVSILAKFGDWGYTSKGWVYLKYVEPFYDTGSGTILNGLNIRTAPNANSEIVGTYTTGDRVTVIEVRESWGRTDLGWINLKYIAYD